MLRAQWWRHRRWKELSGRELEIEKPHREREVCFIARHGRASHIEMPQKRRRFRRCRNFQFVVLVVTAVNSDCPNLQCAVHTGAITQLLQPALIVTDGLRGRGRRCNCRLSSLCVEQPFDALSSADIQRTRSSSLSALKENALCVGCVARKENCPSELRKTKQPLKEERTYTKIDNLHFVGFGKCVARKIQTPMLFDVSGERINVKPTAPSSVLAFADL